MRKKLLILLGIIIVVILFIVKPYYAFATKILHVSPFKILITPDKLKKTNNVVNIVLLGKGGGAHDGPNLTDSINIASINLQTKNIILMSLPRDIWSEPLKEKINAAYAIGEAKDPGKGGLILAKAEVGGVIGQTIHYAAVIDFEKFEELINFFGGVDIHVEKSFTDNQFPIPGRENDTCGGDTDYKCRYESLSFQKGMQHMDGETALNFVRSRHGNNDEGSDFARGKRQQKVISAVMSKTIATLKTLNIKKIEQMYALYNTIIERDITNENASYLAKHFISNKKTVIKQTAIDQSFFEVPDVNVYGAYVLIPKDNSYSQLHSYIECLIEAKRNCSQ